MSNFQKVWNWLSSIFTFLFANIAIRSSDNHPTRRTELEDASVDPRPETLMPAAGIGRGPGNLEPEALPTIRLLVNYELGNLSSITHNVNVDPRDTVSQLRDTMQKFTGVPQDSIYFIYKTTTLQDDVSLSDQGVGSFEGLTMRDNRISYANPF